jgi:predicted transcriptional regulator
MDEYDDHDWENEKPEVSKHSSEEINKLFAEMERKAKKSLHYLILEGFIKPTDIKGVYEYTPEGLVLAQQQYKRMRDDGMI